MHQYKGMLVKELNEKVRKHHRALCLWKCNNLWASRLSRTADVIFSDEARFIFCVSFNQQNIRYWADNKELRN